MDCSAVAALLSQRSLAELSPDQRAAVAAHMDSCPACREKWGLDQQSQVLHDAVKAITPGASVKAGVLSKLDGAPAAPSAPEPTPPAAEPAPAGAPPKRLGGYELLGRLGKGGMGTVLKARQISLDRLVALKILPQRLAQNNDFVQRFLREARSAARLRHPHIVQAIDVGQVEGYYVFAMEFVDGETLEAILRREGPLEPERALRYLKQTTGALAAAHDAGLVHRDIKPSNLMIDKNDEVRVTDFGLAKRTEGDIAVTADGQTLGTPAYVPPEMAKGGVSDARSDLYSLGATFFHLLAGRTPFEGKNFSEVLIKQVNEPPPPLASLAPRCDRRLCHILDRLLRKNPDGRYPTAKALLDDLDGLGKLQTVGQVARAEARAGMAEAPTLPLTSGRRLEREAVRARLERSPGVGRANLHAAKSHASKLPWMIAAGVLLAAIAGYLLLRPGSGTQPTQPAAVHLGTSAPSVAQPVEQPKPAPNPPTPEVPTVKKQPPVEIPEPPKKQPVPEPPAPKPAEWVGLFDGKSLDGWQILEGESFKDHGKVHVADGLLRMELGAGARPVTGIVYKGTVPTDNYEVEYEAMRTGGNLDFADLTFPVGDSICTLVVGGAVQGNLIGLQKVDGQEAHQAAAHKWRPFERNTWYRVKLRVAPDALTAWVDDEQQFTIPRAGHTFNSFWVLAEAKPFGLVTYVTGNAIRSLRLRRLGPAAAPQPTPGEGVSLFDGKTLDGWKVAEKVVKGGDYDGHGQVAVRDGQLVLGGGKVFTGVACTADFPRQEYEFSYEVMRVAGKSAFGSVVLPVGLEHVLLAIGGWDGTRVALHRVDGKPGDLNATNRQMEFENERWYHVRVQVTKAHLKASIDERELVDCPVEGHSFSVDAHHLVLRPIGFQTAYSTTAAFRNIRLRRLGPAVEAQPAEVAKEDAAKAAFAAYAVESDKVWAFFKQRDYPAADKLLAELAARPEFKAIVGGVSTPREKGPRRVDTPPTTADLLQADQAAAALLKEFWAAVERGLAARKGTVSIEGAMGAITAVENGVITLQTAKEAVTRRVLDLKAKQALAYAAVVSKGDERSHLAEAIFRIAEAEDPPLAEKALDAAGNPPGLAFYKVRLAPLLGAKVAKPVEPTPEVQPASGPKWQVYEDWPFSAAEAVRRQKTTARALGVKVEQDIDLGRGVKMAFVLIPAGEFLMGSPLTTSPEKLAAAYGGTPKEYETEFPQHRVKISRPFWLGQFEVTQEQWHALMGNNPSQFGGKPQNPVEQVSWDDCQGFLQKLSAKAKKAYRLPTEAEWEYACRAGAASEFYFGDSKGALGDYAWSAGNSGGMTHPVGRKKPNAWGLHDMAGNVWEWCEDWFGPYEKGDQKDPQGPLSGLSGAARLLRGGAWLGGPPDDFRCAYRNCRMAPSYRRGDYGFRASRTVDVTPLGPAEHPAAEAPKAGEWLSLFDGKTLSGWKVVREGIFAAGGEVRIENETVVLGSGNPVTGAACSGQFPKIDYEMEFEVSRISGGQLVNAVFPVGRSSCALFLYDKSGLDLVDGKRVGDNGTALPLRVETGRWYHVRLRVTQAKVEAWLDDRQIVDLPAQGRTFSVTPDTEPIKPFGFVTFGTASALRNIRVRRLTD